MVHADLQPIMQTLVGSYRTEEDLNSAFASIGHLKQPVQQLNIPGTRMFNAAWHLCADLKSMLTISQAVTRSALARKESRGAHSRIDCPNLDATWGKQNNGPEMRLRQRTIPEMPADLLELLAEEKGARAQSAKRSAQDLPSRWHRWATAEYHVPISPGIVVLDALHYVQKHQAPDLAVRWNCKACRCGSCSAEVNPRPRLTCKIRMDSLPQDKPITILPMKAFPVIKDLVTDVSWNYKVNKKIPGFQPRSDTDWRCSRLILTEFRNFVSVLNAFSVRTSAMFCASTISMSNSAVRASLCELLV